MEQWDGYRVIYMSTGESWCCRTIHKFGGEKGEKGDTKDFSKRYVIMRVHEEDNNEIDIAQQTNSITSLDSEPYIP